MDWLQDILLMFGTGGVTSIILRVIDRKSLTRQTLSVLTYSTLSVKVERLLDQDYATPEHRREIEYLYKLYKAHGWNGDMESRMEKVRALPTKDLNK